MHANLASAEDIRCRERTFVLLFVSDFQMNIREAIRPIDFAFPAQWNSHAFPVPVFREELPAVSFSLSLSCTGWLRNFEYFCRLIAFGTVLADFYRPSFPRAYSTLIIHGQTGAKLVEKLPFPRWSPLHPKRDINLRHFENRALFTECKCIVLVIDRRESQYKRTLKMSLNLFLVHNIELQRFCFWINTGCVSNKIVLDTVHSFDSSMRFTKYKILLSKVLLRYNLSDIVLRPIITNITL